MNYNINRYFSENECSEIVDYCNENGQPFKYHPDEHWDCRKIDNIFFKEKIINKLNNLHLDGKTTYQFKPDFSKTENVTISLTKYYGDRFLNLHLDLISSFTTVIVLSKDFSDGRFVLSKTQGESIRDMGKNSLKIELGMGEGISFDGSNIYHGVMPVKTGIRCALNIWVSSDKFKIRKTLI
jgi:hypothetical protein